MSWPEAFAAAVFSASMAIVGYALFKWLGGGFEK
jgi:hypothetical protein